MHAVAFVLVILTSLLLIYTLLSVVVLCCADQVSSAVGVAETERDAPLEFRYSILAVELSTYSSLLRVREACNLPQVASVILGLDSVRISANAAQFAQQWARDDPRLVVVTQRDASAAQLLNACLVALGNLADVPAVVMLTHAGLVAQLQNAHLRAAVKQVVQLNVVGVAPHIRVRHCLFPFATFGVQPGRSSAADRSHLRPLQTPVGGLCVYKNSKAFRSARFAEQSTGQEHALFNMQLAQTTGHTVVVDTRWRAVVRHAL